MFDIHSHILPNVDDGSTSMEMTHEMLKAAKAAGIHGIVATPHFRSREINLHKIQQAFAQVQEAALQLGMQTWLGFEVHVSLLTHLEMGSIADWCIQGTNAILLEFSNTARPAHWDITVCDLVRNGYKPIIAHPERYTYIQQSMAMAVELRRYGCELQLDADAFSQRLSFGNAQMKTARKLLQNEIVDYISSDAHRPDDYRQLGIVRKRLGSRWPEGKGVLCEALGG